MQAWFNGQCQADADDPSPACNVFKMANAQQQLFKAKYDPSGFFGLFSNEAARATRQQEIENYEGMIDQAANSLRSEFGPTAPVHVKWSQFPKCLWNVDGSPDGPNQNKYIERNDLAGAGYSPQPLIGGETLEGGLPDTITKSMPVWLDGVFNPDYAAVVIFVLLILIFAILLYKAYKWEQKAPERARMAAAKRHRELEATDPYARTSFPSYPEDPKAKWLPIIQQYEAQGVDMTAYREKLGLPLFG